MSARKCEVTECEGRHVGLGLCKLHYGRFKASGSTDARQRPARVDLFLAKVAKSPTCWLWTAFLTPDGYGRFQRGGAHRFSYEMHVGPIPPDLQIDHLCRVRHCVNPEHLEAVTPRENTMRSDAPGALNARVTRCPDGHTYSPDNTYACPRGRRSCRECSRARAREWDHRSRCDGCDERPDAHTPRPNMPLDKASRVGP